MGNYETRACWECVDGRVYADRLPWERPVERPCPACQGTKKVKVFVYPRKVREEKS